MLFFTCKFALDFTRDFNLKICNTKSLNIFILCLTCGMCFEMLEHLFNNKKNVVTFVSFMAFRLFLDLFM